MLVHGDGHYFRIDKPLIEPLSTNMPYFTRVETFGDDDMHWVRIKVKISGTNKDVFTAHPEIVAANKRSLDNKPVRSCGFCTSDKAFDVALLGDTPFFQPMSAWNNMLDDVNQSAVQFAVHVGNLKPDTNACDNNYYNKILGEFNRFQMPIFYTPGDNDWLDCPNAIPEERLARVREIFTPLRNISFGQPPYIFLQSQSELSFYREFYENRMWYDRAESVLFVTIHNVGSNNNAGTPEYIARNDANQRWLELAFQEAKRKDVAAIMIFTHADLMWNDNVVPNPTPPNPYTDIVNKLRDEVIVYDKPVVLVHSSNGPDSVTGYGDGFDFIIDKPLRDATNRYMLENFTRVHVFGKNNAHWIRATIDPEHPDVFLFKPQIVKNNLDAYLND
jgi:hypothetical protein